MLGKLDLRFLLYPPQKVTKLNYIDVILVFVITITAYITHFWTIQHPNDIIFDEVYFGNFTNWYITGKYYFDIHPPFGKLLMFAMAHLAEYNGLMNFDSGQKSTHETPMYVTLRLTPAWFSSLCYPMLYLTARFSGFSYLASFVGSYILVWDTSLLIEQRLILSDGMLHFCCCLFLVIFSYATTLQFASLRWYIWTVISGFALGAASSCKNTAWGLIAYAAFVHFLQASYNCGGFNVDSVAETVVRGLLLAIPTFIMYFGSFAAHFIFLPYSGQGDGYMDQRVKDQLVKAGHENFFLWASRLRRPSLLSRIIGLALNMHSGNMKITNFHPSQSQPFNWPLLTGIRVLFLAKQDKIMACTGNAFVYYIVFASIFIVCAAYKKKNWLNGFRYVFAWAVSYFPFFLVPRTMYLYHYNIPLMIGGVCIAASLDLWLPKYWKGVSAVFILASAIEGFYLWSSFVYATNPVDERFSIWNKNWKFGDEHFHSYSSAHKSS